MEGGFTHAILAEELPNLGSCLPLLEYANDLLLGVLGTTLKAQCTDAKTKNFAETNCII